MADGIRSGGGRKPAEICRPQMHQQSKQRECPTEYAEHTEPSGREVPPTDRHRCALIRRVWQDAIPTPPITQPNHLWKSVKSVGEYYHAGAAASAAPTKQMGRVSHRTRRTHRTFWQRKPPTDRHGYAQIRRVWHPAIPTPPITQPNHLWKSVKSVGEYYHAPKQADGERMSHRTRGTHRTFWQRKPPTDRHRCALIRRVWQDAIPTPPITQPNHLWKSVNSVGEYYHAHKQANGERVPTEYAEHTEHSGRESLPQIGTDAHRLGGYGIPAIPTLPITQPNHLWKSVKSVGEYYHAGAAASAAPTKQTERVFPQNTRNTQNILAEKASHR